MTLVAPNFSVERMAAGAAVLQNRQSLAAAIADLDLGRFVRHEQPSARFESITTGGFCCDHRIRCWFCCRARSVRLVDRALCYP